MIASGVAGYLATDWVGTATGVAAVATTKEVARAASNATTGATAGGPATLSLAAAGNAAT